MTNRNRNWTWPLVLLLAAVVAAPAWAQEVELDPDAKPPAGKTEPAGKEKTKPKAKPRTITPADLVVEQADPAVKAVLATEPTTPSELTRAAKILADLNKPKLSREFLQRVLAANLDEKQLADLAEKHGSALFMNLAERPELQPEAKQLSEAVLSAVNQQLQDPQRLQAKVRELANPSFEARTRAYATLQLARGAAVGPLLDVLADSARAAEYPNVRAALVGLGDDAIEPLLGTLEKSEPRIMAQTIQVLADLKAKQVSIFLLGPAAAEQSDPQVRAAAVAALKRLTGHEPSRREAVQTLHERAKAYFDRKRPVPGEIAGEVTTWSWDVNKKQCVAATLRADDAARALAARLARDAFALAPRDTQVRLLYLATMLEEAVYQNGLDKRLPEGEGSVAALAAKFGPQTVESVLDYAVRGGHPAAATAAAQILGMSEGAADLLYQNAQPCPLAAALQHSDRRLRLAAAEAIVRLEPAKAFPGASFVPETLAFLAATKGSRRALVGGSNSQSARDLAGMFSEAGLETDTATSGREFLRLATTSPDYELALIDPAIEQPTIDMLLQQLRRDCRGADLRVGLIARAGWFDVADRVAGRQVNTLSFARPHDEEAFRWQQDQLGTLSPREFVGHEERQSQAARALEALAALSSGNSRFYELRRIQNSVLAALYTPALGTKTIAVLAALGTPESQRALVDLASRHTQPLETRQAAAKAFVENAKRHRTLLTTAEIRRQYARYNESESLDAETQHVLSTILDAIEAPTQAVKAKADGKAEAKAE
jgi:CheY-like chemotaxis protein